MPTPKRGEVWLADLGFVAKTRPVLVSIYLFQILIMLYIPLYHIPQAREVPHLRFHFP